MHKFKRMVYFFPYLLLFTAISSACAETPPEVKKEIEEIKEAKKERRELQRTLTYVHVSELQKDAQEMFSMDHGVFRFEGSVVVPECDNVYLLEMKANDEIFINIDRNVPFIMEHIGAGEDNWKEYITDESGTGKTKESDTACSYDEKGYCFIEMNEIYISIKHSGGICIGREIQEEKHPNFLAVDGDILQTCYFVNNRESALNREIDLNGGKATLFELNNTFEKEMELINDCSPNLNLILHDARIIEDKETKETMVVFRALGSHKGVCFDSNYITPQDSEAMGGRSFVGFEMNQQIHKKEDNCETAVRETSYIVSEEKKKIDKVIDFGSALSLIEHTAPQDKLTTIESAEFMYQIYYEGEEGQGWNYICEQPPVFYAAPIWKFVEKDRPNEMKATVYYVDAVSGEVYSFYRACTP